MTWRICLGCGRLFFTHDNTAQHNTTRHAATGPGRGGPRGLRLQHRADRHEQGLPGAVPKDGGLPPGALHEGGLSVYERFFYPIRSTSGRPSAPVGLVDTTTHPPIPIPGRPKPHTQEDVQRLGVVMVVNLTGVAFSLYRKLMNPRDSRRAIHMWQEVRKRPSLIHLFTHAIKRFGSRPRALKERAHASTMPPPTNQQRHPSNHPNRPSPASSSASTWWAPPPS